MFNRFKSEDDRAAFWKAFKAFTAADWKDFAIANHAAGYHNPVFAPAMDDGDVFCVWECVDPTTTVEQFAEYVDGPSPQTRLLKHFVNECHACDAVVGVWPDAKHQADARGGDGGGDVPSHRGVIDRQKNGQKNGQKNPKTNAEAASFRGSLSSSPRAARGLLKTDLL